MDEQAKRTLLKAELLGYVSLLDSRGINFPIPDDEQLNSMPIADLFEIVRQAQRLARTPST